MLGAAIYWVHRAIETDRICDWVGFAISSVLGGYVHYYMALMVAAAGAAWLFDRAILRQKFFRGSVCFAMIGVCCLPLVSLLREDYSFSEHYPAEVGADLYSTAYTYFSFLSGFAFGASISELHDYVDSPHDAILAMMPAIVGSFALLAVPMFFGSWTLRKDRRGFLLTLSFAGIPVAAATGLAREFELNYNVRYVVGAAIPCLLMVGVGISRARLDWSPRTNNSLKEAQLRRVVLTGLLLAGSAAWLATGSIRRLTVERYFNEDM